MVTITNTYSAAQSIYSCSRTRRPLGIMDQGTSLILLRIQDQHCLDKRHKEPSTMPWLDRVPAWW